MHLQFEAKYAGEYAHYSDVRKPVVERPQPFLAIETSCDDTCAAVLCGTRVMSNVKLFQAEHKTYGGVVPELAARLHSDRWTGAVQSALDQANVTMQDIEKIVVTAGPGLSTSLLVGVTAAQTLTHRFKKPLVPIHHIWGHVASVALDIDAAEIAFPALCLTVSGGHTMITKVHSWSDISILGTTIDDAAGEAFDKVARALGLPYPGGPHISQQAEMGNPHAFDLPFPLREKANPSLSFSGLKSATTRIINDSKNPLTEAFIRDMSASFQRQCVHVLTTKMKRQIATHSDTKEVWLVGGVAANITLQQSINTLAHETKKTFRMPQKLSYCTDNAAMIGAAAHLCTDLFMPTSGIITPRSRWSMTEH